MYNIERVRILMCEKSGSVKAFCRDNGLKYTTIRSSMGSSDQFGHMPIDNYLTIARGLGMGADELYDLIAVKEAE